MHMERVQALKKDLINNIIGKEAKNEAHKCLT